jgi:hypothetical protein
MVDKVAVRLVSVRVLSFSSTSVIPPMLHIHLHLNVSVSRGQKTEAGKNFKKAILFPKSKGSGAESNFTEALKRFKSWLQGVLALLERPGSLVLNMVPG